MKSIKIKLFVLFLIVTAAALIPTLITIRNSISSTWQKNAVIELTQKSNLIKTLLNVERISLQKLVMLIAEEPTLKMSIQLADPATIQDTLSQLQSMLHADLIMITDAEGNISAEVYENSEDNKSKLKASPFSVIRNSLERGN